MNVPLSTSPVKLNLLSQLALLLHITACLMHHHLSLPFSSQTHLVTLALQPSCAGAAAPHHSLLNASPFPFRFPLKRTLSRSYCAAILRCRCCSTADLKADMARGPIGGPNTAHPSAAKARSCALQVGSSRMRRRVALCFVFCVCVSVLIVVK